jgi:tRNA threonylcarbamoyladenosine biosynthesis protein TsaE
MSRETHTTTGPEQTEALGRALAERLAPGDCVSLNGPLGAGKTVLTRGIAAGLGLADTRLVASPTYVLVHEYPARAPVYHLDLYRMTAPEEELEALGFEEMLDDGVVLIEWASKAEAVLPPDRWRVSIRLLGPEQRLFTIRRGEGGEADSPRERD